MNKLFLPTIFLFASICPTMAQKLTPELLWKVPRLALENSSPDGNLVVYGVQRYDMEADKGTRVLMLFDLRTKQSIAISDASKTSSDAEFHPNGKSLAYLQGGKLFEYNLLTKQTAQVGDIEMNGFHFSPDGTRILFTQDVKMDAKPTETYPDLPKSTAKIADGLFYRHWKSWHDHAYSQIFFAGYAAGKVIGQPKNILNERFDSPLTPMGGMEQIRWSPKGDMIVYTCRKANGSAEAISTNSDLYVYELSSGRTLNMTEGMMGYDQDPLFSPDGNHIVWTSMEEGGYEADRTRLMLLDTRNNQRREITAGWKFEANHPCWAADGKTLFFISAEDFTQQIYAYDLASDKIRRITSGLHDYTDLRRTATALVASRVSMTQPPELFQVDLGTGTATALTAETASTWDAFPKAKVERRTVITFDGKDMNVWMVLPPGFDAKKKYPALVYCQGGPQSILGQGFSFRWNISLMAAQGYVIVAPCRRGMPGSGEDWNDAITGHWGDAMKDILAATDAAAKEPFIDATKMGAVGASFGGYAVYWLAGNHQKRFKAFISHCGLFNLESFYGTTEELWFPHHDFEGAYWQTPKPFMYQRESPHLFVQNWDTPILVIHNELDFRVPFGEGMQAFQAAQLQKIPSRFLSFPDEGHWMSKPQNSLLWQREFFAWLDKYLKN
jgi:dipeptidyl aminopeptidase/acylaminoacyl peptidase